MSIGEVLAQLRPDFPETTVSKLRFLESEGLVEPQRTPSGYRKYSWADVARLRFVLTAQRDHYLPLRVIREQLQRLDRGENVDSLVGTPSRVPALALVNEGSRAEDSFRGDTRLSRAELLEQAQVIEETLADLERHGLVSPRSGGYYDRGALEIVVIARELAGFGVQARHLRAYRVAADRQLGLFEQIVAPLLRQRDPAAQARAEEVAQELTALSLRLHAVLLQAGLKGTLGS